VRIHARASRIAFCIREQVHPYMYLSFRQTIDYIDDLALRLIDFELLAVGTECVRPSPSFAERPGPPSPK